MRQQKYNMYSSLTNKCTFINLKNTLKFILKYIYTRISLLHVSVFDHHQGAWAESGYTYIYVKTFGEITSLFIMWLCGSMSWSGVCVVCCAECDRVAFCTVEFLAIFTFFNLWLCPRLYLSLLAKF